MRNVGEMGESTFSLWCSSAGLTANKSNIDKNGWDFIVEFPFASTLTAANVHKAPYECRVQVKATDNTTGKLAIKLSNLRRLVTAPTPAFFVFIEFDKKDQAQRAYVVHVDNEMITDVLERLCEIEASGGDAQLNKRTKTIHYHQKHLIENTDGESLKKTFTSYIGNDLSEYILNKEKHLESTGYEASNGIIKFKTPDKDYLKTLIDVSLGLKDEVVVSDFKCSSVRFGIQNTNSTVYSETAKLRINNLKPSSIGKVRFQEDSLSSGMLFDSELYTSPFSPSGNKEYFKIRIKNQLFELIMTPFENSSSYSFSLEPEQKFDIKKLRSALRLLYLLCQPEKKISAEFISKDGEKLPFKLKTNEAAFDFEYELSILDCAVELLHFFEVDEIIEISINDIIGDGDSIRYLSDIVFSGNELLNIKFKANGVNLPTDKDCVYTSLITTKMGTLNCGIVLSIIGCIHYNTDSSNYKLSVKEKLFSHKITMINKDITLDNNLISLLKETEKQYYERYYVISTLPT